MFKLNIESSKDITELHINFADGTSVIKSGEQTDKIVGTVESRPHTGEQLDTDTDYGNIPQERITPPNIPDQDRPTNVAPELQNLDI